MDEYLTPSVTKWEDNDTALHKCLGSREVFGKPRGEMALELRVSKL